MGDTKQVRKWWINIFSRVVFPDADPPGLALQMDHEVIYVIEKSAYDDLNIEYRREIELHHAALVRADKLEASNRELREALDYCFDSMCKHTGELHPGSGREWCLTCSAWVYKSDKNFIEAAREALARGKGES